MARCALTTSDNPWSPITNWDEWFAFDYSHGYYTCSYLDRIAATSNNFSDEMNDQIIEDAIDEIIKMNLIAAQTDNKVCYMKVRS